MAVHADFNLGVGMAGEIAVTDGQLIAMAHLGQNLEKFRGQNLRNTFQHGIYLRCFNLAVSIIL